MKQLNHYINRDKSVLTNKKNLESICIFKNFPTFMGCVSSPQSEDIMADMDWCIDPENGVIQLKKLVPLEILYLNQHNDGTGKIWQDLYREFAEFILRWHRGPSILEIGGAHDKIANNFFMASGHASWVIIEPNPENIHNDRVSIIKSWFDENTKLDFEIDTIVHSHVIEHTFEPKKFITQISKNLQFGGRHIFALPNMLPMLENKFTNCLNFEHTVFLTEFLVDRILAESGFKIMEKKYFGNPHSIFYATEKSLENCVPITENKYGEYINIFNGFIDYHRKMVDELNQKILAANDPVYLFGAHVFSQYLINFGLNVEKIVSILDNSPLKQGKRLCGTNLLVESPKILASSGPKIVILKAGIYNDEIKKDILENINSEVEFW